MTDVEFRVIVNIVAVVFVLVMAYESLHTRASQWLVRPCIAQEVFSADRFSTGDLLLVFGQGHESILYPGHMAIVVELPRYRQKFVWDMPLPFLHSPNVLKPLAGFVAGTLKRRGAKLYVHHLAPTCAGTSAAGLTRQLLPLIKSLSVNAHYKLQTVQDHLNFCMRRILGMPGIPDLLPTPSSDYLHYCSSAVLGMLVQTGVLKPEILTSVPTYVDQRWLGVQGRTVYPQMFVHPDWEIAPFVQGDAWSFGPLVRISHGSAA